MYGSLDTHNQATHFCICVMSPTGFKVTVISIICEPNKNTILLCPQPHPWKIVEQGKYKWTTAVLVTLVTTSNTVPRSTSQVLFNSQRPLFFPQTVAHSLPHSVWFFVLYFSVLFLFCPSSLDHRALTGCYCGEKEHSACLTLSNIFLRVW